MNVSLHHSLGQTATGISLHVNSAKTEFVCFNQDGPISLNGKPLKLVDQFVYLCSNIFSTERDVNISID